MSTLLSDTQTQRNTVSQNGRNITPALISNSHFFIESNGSGAFQQATTEKFGILSDTQFRTTARINVSASKKVYAICQGQVFLQPQANSSTKVNLILRPFRQPIKGLSILFFIYRGLNKADFISGTGTNATIVGSETAGTGFVQHIWKEFNAFFDNETASEPKPGFSAKMIGFPEGNEQQETDLINNYFYKLTLYDDADQQVENADTAYELPMIPKGIHLGNVNGTLGLDIVLNKGDYYIENDINPFQLNLAFARTAEGKLDTSDGDTDYKKKLIKEFCIQFIDPAAFYGLHCNGYGKLFINDAATPLTTKEDIYKHVQNFHTKNTLYLYIQSNRQRSYDFYGNYAYNEDNPNNIKTGTDETSLNENSFDTQGWPIHTIENQEKFYIQLTTDNHTTAGLYVKTGTLISEHEQKFIRAKNLLHTASVDENTPIDKNYTQPIGFSAITKDNTAIATFIQLIYEGKQLIVSEYVPPPQPGEQATEPRQFIVKDIDDLFGLVNVKSFVKTKSDLKLNTVIGEELQLINFPSSRKKTDIGIVKTKRIEDAINKSEDEILKRVTYETLLHSSKNNNSSYLRATSSSIDNASSGISKFSKKENNFYRPKSPYYFVNQLLTHENKTITTLSLRTTNNSTPTKKILGISEEENQKLKDLITQYQLNNCKIFFKKKVSSNNQFESIEGIQHNTYNLKLLAENDIRGLKIYTPVDNIKLYSIDDFVFTTDEYAKYSPVLIPISETLLIYGAWQMQE